ncbi:transcriptional regulator [Nakamurella flava]|uniref:Transcriptional regulator n=1 Tax=Nakamurella flava TaxID=2576308 RepID=A0A4U6Q8V7_9ACTN|nr:ATP-binding protein [Nakamurella flava]TKV56307.1 transcriptional regulator [Nakamurella flava]
MDDSDLAAVLSLLRRLGGEPSHIEAKKAEGGLPKSLRETLSAFANTDGGSIILGVDESAGFAVINLADPMGLRDGLVQMARDDITPALQIAAEVTELEGHLVVAAEVPAAPSDARPVYVTAQGLATGSYIRGGDGDRRMTQAEIALSVAGRGQPVYDREPVLGSSRADLDVDQLQRTLRRIRSSGHRWAAQADDTALTHRLGITTGSDEDAPLTLAGLLCYGLFPQQFFPQLMLSVVVHPPQDSESVRFIDNQTVRGAIPEMVENALRVIQRNTAVRSTISERGGRQDEPDYPAVAVREALVNALLHRDYSPTTRGTQVQVDITPEQLKITSPGGLFGGVLIESLGDEGISSSRNATLASLLSETYLPSSDDLVCENRATGIPSMMAAARRRGISPPHFSTTISRFVVSMDRSELLGPTTQKWIDSLRANLPTNHHRIAIALLRSGPVTNEMLRQWGIDRIQAGAVLRDIVDQNLAIRDGGRRYARYTLAPGSPADSQPDLFGEVSPLRQAEGRTASLIGALVKRGTAKAADLVQDTGLSRTAVVNQLNKLIESGAVEAIGHARSPTRTYRWATDTPTPTDR